MADQLATPGDLATLTGLDATTDAALLLLQVETATGVVQAAAGRQRIVEVAGDQVTLIGGTTRWLDLPQVPVTSVAQVAIDGSTVTDWKLFGGRLFRRCGWAASSCEPSSVAVTYTHGYPSYRQELQLARAATLGIAATAADALGGVRSEAIDDYRVTYADAAERAVTEALRRALRRQYGRRGGWS